MTHPNGGKGNTFHTTHTFSEAYKHVGTGITFTSTTEKKITARQRNTKGKIPRKIVFIGENSTHGDVCEACWGYRLNCSGTRIGHCVEGLDKSF